MRKDGETFARQSHWLLNTSISEALLGHERLILELTHRHGYEQNVDHRRPNRVARAHRPPVRSDCDRGGSPPEPDAVEPIRSPLVVDVIEPPPRPGGEGAAVEFELRIPANGDLRLRADRQVVSLPPSMAGRLVTIWADLRSIHVSYDGNIIRSVSSRLRPEDLSFLAMRGARRAGAEPARSAIRKVNGVAVIAAGQAVEIERTVTKDGRVGIGGTTHLVGFAWAGR
ncbi:hypothetical protein [Nocardia xishanensis]